MVKQGYKQTEIGLIPNDWNIVSIEKLATDMSDGPFGSNLKKEHYTDDKQARIIQLSNIGENGWLDTNVKYTTFSHAKTISRCIVNPGHIIVAKMMPAGRAIICPSMEKMYVLGSDSIKLELNATLVNTKYFMYSTKSSFFQTQIKEETQGSTRARTSISKLRKNKVLLPSIEEQKRIAEALSDVDSMISSFEKLIAKKKAVKQGAMQELLTGKKRLPGFTGAWKEKQIGEYGDFVSGNGFPLKYQGNPSGLYPFYKVSDFNNVGNSREMIKANNYISDDVANILSCNIIPKQSIVFAKIGAAIALERKRITSCVCCIDNNMMSFQPYEKETAQFMCYLFQTIRFEELVEATALPSLSGKTIGEIKKIFPPTSEEQIAISSILSDMDNEIEALEQKLKKTRQVKQGMMQKLLTGKIRLV